MLKIGNTTEKLSIRSEDEEVPQRWGKCIYYPFSRCAPEGVFEDIIPDVIVKLLRNSVWHFYLLGEILDEIDIFVVFLACILGEQNCSEIPYRKWIKSDSNKHPNDNEVYFNWSFWGYITVTYDCDCLSYPVVGGNVYCIEILGWKKNYPR